MVDLRKLDTALGKLRTWSQANKAVGIARAALDNARVEAVKTAPFGSGVAPNATQLENDSIDLSTVESAIGTELANGNGDGTIPGVDPTVGESYGAIVRTVKRVFTDVDAVIEGSFYADQITGIGTLLGDFKNSAANLAKPIADAIPSLANFGIDFGLIVLGIVVALAILAFLVLK